MKLLLIGDLHLTDRPRDAYRFSIFKWIREQQKLHLPTHTVLMGDLCDQKDKHGAALVNKITDELVKLQPPVLIIKGNHDYIHEGEPFFRFLNRINGLNFVVNPVVVDDAAIIPHCREEATFSAAVTKFGRNARVLLLHNTVAGAIAESGAPLSGFSGAPIEALPEGVSVYAGDVHKPQRAGRVTYVGAPYTIRFGDDFEPRCLLVENDKRKNLYFDCPHKWKLTIRSADEILKNEALFEGDQVKVTIELVREEAVEAKTYMRQVREACEKKGLELFGLDVRVATASKQIKGTETAKHKTADEIITSFCKAERVSSQVREAGLALLKG